MGNPPPTTEKERELEAELSQLKGNITSERLQRVERRNDNRAASAIGLGTLVFIYLASLTMACTPFMQWLAIIGFIYAARQTAKYVQQKNHEEEDKEENQPLY